MPELNLGSGFQQITILLRAIHHADPPSLSSRSAG